MVENQPLNAVLAAVGHGGIRGVLQPPEQLADSFLVFERGHVVDVLRRHAADCIQRVFGCGAMLADTKRPDKPEAKPGRLSITRQPPGFAPNVTQPGFL